MEEKLEEVVEETTQENITKVDTSQAKEEASDNITKVNLDKPPTPKEEKNETTENSDDQTGVVEDVKSEDAGATQ